MAIAAPREHAQAYASSFIDTGSHAAGFPSQMLLRHSTCKGAASMTPAVLSFRNADCSSLETDDVYGFEDDRSPLLLQYRFVQSIGAGLANLGNTCFLNSVLQCLTYTPPLAAHLQAGLHNMSCNIKGFCAMCVMEKHVRDALSSRGRIISPGNLVKNLRSISRSFQLWRQEDAHEYMRYLIEALQRCCTVELLGGESFIRGVFGGRLRSQVKCTQCSYCSNTYDPFLDLSLEVNRADSLNKALEHFTAIEVLDGDNQYHCSKCNIKVRALKQFTIDKAPPILTVQFKRFSNSGLCGGKIDKKVHFEKDLDLTPFVTGAKDGELSYSLYAVLVHFGWSTHSGHYYCFVRTASDTWHAMDDSKVSQVSEKTVLAQRAYILFYARNVRSTDSTENNFLREDCTNSTISSLQKHDHCQKGSYDLEMPENRCDQVDSSNCPLSNEAGCICSAEQAVTCVELQDNSSKALLSKESQEKLPFSPEAAESDGGKQSLFSAQKNTSSKIAKCLIAESLDDTCEESWYRAVQIMNNLSINLKSVKTQAGDFACPIYVAEAQEETCARELGLRTSDSCGHDISATSSCFGDDTNVNLESDEMTPQSHCERKHHSFFDLVCPILRTARFVTGGHHAFSIICMCAKYCFWSCFWPRL